MPTDLLRDSRGAAAIEFALLAPAIIMMLLGVLMVGLHMQSYNSARSIVYDVNRYTVVEYQKNNQIDEGQIEEVARSIATSSPYNFPTDNLNVTVGEVASGMTGAKRFNMTLTYTPIEIALPMDIGVPTIVKSHSIIVPE